MSIPEILFSPANQGTDYGFDSTEKSRHAKRCLSPIVWLFMGTGL
jgi:hypothetical protein